ncbi:MAG: hypothetical protein K0U41_09005 [Gammaproteobacteria bacterium]|nr:hypothetical protein [Gammaproteobacteria bacterium]
MTGARIPPFLLEKRDNSIMGAVARRAEGRKPLNTRTAIQLCKSMVKICDIVYSGGTWGEIKAYKSDYDGELRVDANIKIPVSGGTDGATHFVQIYLKHTLYRGITMDAMAGGYDRYPEVKFYDMKALRNDAEQAGKDLVAWVDGLMVGMGQTRLP